MTKTIEKQVEKAIPTDESAAQYLKRRQEETKATLEKEPKVSFIIPLASGEKPGSFEIVNINGYQFTIKKGEMVEIPKSVASILADHYRFTMKAGENMRVDRTEVKDGVSIQDALS